MTDAWLSLVVARIMYPEYEWVVWGGVAVSDNDGMEFSYTDKDCAWDMAVWLANQDNDDIGSYPSLIMSEIITEENPQHALAMAIKEIGGLNG